MGWLAGLLVVLVVFWLLGKLTGKKELLEFRERLGLSWSTVTIMILLLFAIFYVTFR